MHACVRPALRVLALIMTAASFPGAQQPPGNYDEGKVPSYTLPDPLVMTDGTKVTTAEDGRHAGGPSCWTFSRARSTERRRPHRPRFERLSIRPSPTRSVAPRFDVR
jgi:hypothetical protein